MYKLIKIKHNKSNIYFIYYVRHLGKCIHRLVN